MDISDPPLHYNFVGRICNDMVPTAQIFVLSSMNKFKKMMDILIMCKVKH